MAWIEARKKQYRVYWRTPTGRQYEPFKSHSDAQRFMALAEAVNDLEKARAFVRGADIDLSVATGTPPDCA